MDVKTEQDIMTPTHPTMALLCTPPFKLSYLTKPFDFDGVGLVRDGNGLQRREQLFTFFQGKGFVFRPGSVHAKLIVGDSDPAIEG